MYTKDILEMLEEKNIEVGDRITIFSKGKTYDGILMPRSGESDILVLKLNSGYNIGLKLEEEDSIDKSFLETPEEIEEQMDVLTGKYHKHLEVEHNPSKPNITILSTGGTIASRIDYRTGGVKPTFEASELITMIPEIAEIANITGTQIMSIDSEDMTFENYTDLTNRIAEEIERGADGIIITHGTDTIHYTSAALSFSLEDIQIPVLLVGSQRSSDRGSSDGPWNLILAAKFIAETDFVGVATCMRALSGNEGCLIIKGTKARKFHTSSREAIRSVNEEPVALITESSIMYCIENYDRKGNNHSMNFKPKFESNVALIKTFVNMNPEIFESMTKGMKGIVIEGTGLGHTPKELIPSIEKYLKKGIVVMTSQCVNGRVNMNVYSRGRDLLKIGVIPGEDMTAETALIKLSWLLANYPKDEIEYLIKKNLRGEISDRTLK